MTADVAINNAPLKALVSGLAEAKTAYVKVGVLGSSTRRGKGETASKRWLSTAKWSRGLDVRNAKGKTVHVDAGYLTNAEIGAIHEFGSPGDRIPERSFLRMPLLSRLDDELRKVSKAEWANTLLIGGLVAVLRVVGQAGVNVIKDAFHTGGFGRWAKLKAATIRRKGNSDILIDSTQLSRSISFAVVAK